MKAAIAAFIVASMDFLEKNGSKFRGTIAMLFTADEEGEAEFGTKSVIKWLKKENQY